MPRWYRDRTDSLRLIRLREKGACVTMLQRPSLANLEKLLRLHATGFEQDWDVELADADRVGEFLRAYDEVQLTTDDRVALMALIVASVDRFLGEEGRVPDEWSRIEALLVKDHVLHAQTIKYWACEDADEPEGWFSITPLVRSVGASKPDPG